MKEVKSMSDLLEIASNVRKSFGLNVSAMTLRAFDKCEVSLLCDTASEALEQQLQENGYRLVGEVRSGSETLRNYEKDSDGVKVIILLKQKEGGE